MNNGRILTEELLEELLHESDIDYETIEIFFHDLEINYVKALKLIQEDDVDLGNGLFEASYYLEDSDGDKYGGGDIDPCQKSEIEKFIRLLNN